MNEFILKRFEKTHPLVGSFLVGILLLICLNCAPEYVVHTVKFRESIDIMKPQDAIDSLEILFGVQFDSSVVEIIEEIYGKTKKRKIMIVKLGMLSYEKAKIDFVFQSLHNYLEFLHFSGDSLTILTEEEMKLFIEQTEMVDLARYAAKFGLISIYSDPSGADVYINGKNEKRKTPVDSLSYRTGNHFLRLHKSDDLEDIQDIITVHENKETKKFYKFSNKKKGRKGAKNK